jgi:acetyl-CoA acyltransferase
MPELSTKRPVGGRGVVVVAGGRLPFSRAGTDYRPLISYDLARMAIAGVLEKADMSGADLDQVVLGSVIQNVATSNVARDAALAAGVPDGVPAHTVTVACISANRAIADAAMSIATGHTDAALAGGVEMLGDVPVTFDRDVRSRLFDSRKYRSPREWGPFFKGLKPRQLLPRAPAIAEFTTGESMGESADRLAATFGVTRQEQDAYALRSHQGAAWAQAGGLFAPELIRVAVPPMGVIVSADNGVRADTSLEKLARLKPAFVKPFGTVTAGNASPLTDGAAAVILMAQEAAAAQGRKPLARIADFLFVAQDPGDELLLGPAFAAPRLLARNGLSLDDVQVIEIHEAFAGQVLAVLSAWQSAQFGQQRLGLPGAFAQVQMERVNPWGGSISLGHPFGATGARLLTTAARRLHVEDAQWALVTACAAGGQGHAMLLERVDA